MRQRIQAAVGTAIRRNAAWFFFVAVLPSFAGALTYSHLAAQERLLEVDGAGQARELPGEPEVTITFEEPTPAPTVAPTSQPVIETPEPPTPAPTTTPSPERPGIDLRQLVPDVLRR